MSLGRLTQAALRERASRHPENLLFWAEAYRRIAGRSMVVPPALHAIYEDHHPFLVIRKPSQVGITEFNLNLALWAADTGYADRGVILYLLPTGEMADRISQARMSKAIAESPYLRRRAKPDSGIARGPANIQRRAVGRGIIYFAGVEQETQYSGIDADIVILDEFDLMKEEVLPLAQARLRSSAASRLVVTSTPSVTDVGISFLFDASDQQHYELLCPGCGSWQEPRFPEGVDWEHSAVVCATCRSPLDPLSSGRWAARSAETAIRGYQLNRLGLPRPPLADMKLALDGAIPTTTETFYRQDLGQPFSSPDSRLTVGILDACVEPPSWDPALRLKVHVMGIDVGRKLHVVIRGRRNGRWYLFEAFTVDSFEELEPCFVCYNVSACVVDALPETRKARRFQERHPGVVWLAQYTQQGLEPEWVWRDGLVRAPRTVILDETLHRFRERVNVLPAGLHSLADGEYVRHLLAPVRTVELDTWGQPFAVYKNRQRDDFAHAEVYATLATMRAAYGEVSIIRLGYTPWGGVTMVSSEPDAALADFDLRV